MPTQRECANAVRALSIDAIEKAKSGHPGAPLGMADMAEVLWRHFLKHNPANPQWLNRDRFILSNGHASMLLYALLHLSGYDLPMEEIQNFRQWSSRTPGHPERGLTPGVEMTTGPLGQGLASAVGFALAEAILAATFNRADHEIIDHYTYVFCGDGCLMEGISHEACSLAGTWKLGKLIVFYDANGVSIDGSINAWFNEDVAMRYKAYAWQVLGPINGHDSAAIAEAIKAAQSDKDHPSLIICQTHIGFGSPKKDSASSHGSPLGSEALAQTKIALGWTYAPFELPAELREAWNVVDKGIDLEKAWNEKWASYKQAYPELAEEFSRRMQDELPADWQKISKELLATIAKIHDPQATRVSSKLCLEELVPKIPALIGGSADLSSSVGTEVKASKPYNPNTHLGNYLYYGVREFAMGAIMNGLAMHGGFIPYAGTFLAFSDQAKNAFRLSSIMSLRVIWILTHDSVGVGEDGPTHQPIEQLPTLRLIPNLLVWRPADAVETAQAWISILETIARPACLVLSRQGLPQLDRSPEQIKDIKRGGYIIRDCPGRADIILISSGSELALAVEAAAILAQKGYACKVVAMPCAELFDAQPAAWRDKVLNPDVRCRLVIEASSPDLGMKYAGLDGAVMGMDYFGASAPGKILFDKYGFNVDNIVQQAEKLLKK